MFTLRDMQLKDQQLAYGKQIKAGVNSDEIIQNLAEIHEYRMEMQVGLIAMMNNNQKMWFFFSREKKNEEKIEKKTKIEIFNPLLMYDIQSETLEYCFI